MTDKFLGWINTFAALIVPASLGGAFNTFLIRQFFLSLPRELEDAALIDGATPFQIFFQIILPSLNRSLPSCRFLCSLEPGIAFCGRC